MNILEETQKLIAKYDLRPNSYVDENPFKRKRAAGDWLGENDSYFQESKVALELFVTKEKFARVEKSWYGFDLFGVPPKWILALEEFVVLLEQNSPDFKFLQWKLKMGGFRGYTANISENAQESINLLEEVLHDEKLIY